MDPDVGMRIEDRDVQGTVCQVWTSFKELVSGEATPNWEVRETARLRNDSGTLGVLANMNETE